MGEAWKIRVRGQVQGVGFRPFVWALAHRLGLSGEVHNDAEGVLIHAAGAPEVLETLVVALRGEAPPLARIDGIEVAPWAVSGAAPTGFEIAASGPAGAQTRVAPDAATCPACLAEIFDPAARRFGYAFTNCTHCGPRFTIIEGLPYDRARTTMAAFPLCPACAAEYADPADRRFHSQPVACPDCGPRLWFEAGGEAVAGEAIGQAAAMLRAGGIVAVKGLGGFHLACDAAEAEAVSRLRARKRRPAKPFALMGTEAMIAAHARPSAAEWARLRDPAAPIVLLAREGAALPETVAPGMGRLGWMLPATPLHHLLLAAVNRPLVMTSGNLSGEPQVIGNQEARDKLAGFVDGFVIHDREIARRLDDSVEQVTPAGPMILRRARGRVPGVLALPPGFEAAGDVLATGGQMKAALCLTKNGQALLGHHLGDLGSALSWEAWQAALADYTEIFDHRPGVIAVDLHEGYRATQAGAALARDRGLPLVRVQHHHAHLASVLGEHLWPLEAGPVVAIVLDGLGLGTDGTIWGGEVLLGDYRQAERIGHLLPAPLIGGDAASREPWRNLLARLDAAGLSALADGLLADAPRETLRAAARAGLNAPLSSSAGRLFDAFAAALGLVAGAMSFEGEAGMRLEALAAGALEAAAGNLPPYPFGEAGGVIDPAPMWRVWAEAEDPAEVAAARFHEGLAAAFAAVARRAVEAGRAGAVALSGGVMQNAVLEAALLRHLKGLPVLRHREVPANDGGLALGQALVAAARML